MKVYYSRPKNLVARKAWDTFAKAQVRTQNPVEMRLAFLSFWVWVMKYSDGQYEEIERSELWPNRTSEWQGVLCAVCYNPVVGACDTWRHLAGKNDHAVIVRELSR